MILPPTILQRVEQVVDVPEDERICPECGTPFKCIGDERLAMRQEISVPTLDTIFDWCRDNQAKYALPAEIRPDGLVGQGDRLCVEPGVDLVDLLYGRSSGNRQQWLRTNSQVAGDRSKELDVLRQRGGRPNGRALALVHGQCDSARAE